MMEDFRCEPCDQDSFHHCTFPMATLPWRRQPCRPPFPWLICTSTSTPLHMVARAPMADPRNYSLASRISLLSQSAGDVSCLRKNAISITMFLPSPLLNHLPNYWTPLDSANTGDSYAPLHGFPDLSITVDTTQITVGSSHLLKSLRSSTTGFRLSKDNTSIQNFVPYKTTNHFRLLLQSGVINHSWTAASSILGVDCNLPQLVLQYVIHGCYMGTTPLPNCSLLKPTFACTTLGLGLCFLNYVLPTGSLKVIKSSKLRLLNACCAKNNLLSLVLPSKHHCLLIVQSGA